jgi:hypothetical protein
MHRTGYFGEETWEGSGPSHKPIYIDAHTHTQNKHYPECPLTYLMLHTIKYGADTKIKG